MWGNRQEADSRDAAGRLGFQAAQTHSSPYQEEQGKEWGWQVWTVGGESASTRKPWQAQQEGWEVAKRVRQSRGRLSGSLKGTKVSE